MLLVSPGRMRPQPAMLWRGPCTRMVPGHFTSGVLDANDAGVAQNVAFTGTYSGIDAATGEERRPSALRRQGTTNYSFYVVSATQLLVMEIDQVLGQGSPIVSGSMLQQSGPFDAS